MPGRDGSGDDHDEHLALADAARTCAQTCCSTLQTLRCGGSSPSSILPWRRRARSWGSRLHRRGDPAAGGCGLILIVAVPAILV
ncbi:MAG: hypothetical protein ACJ8AW_30310 [Rhodopila sp.]